MGDEVNAGFFADVLEMAVPIVLEQNVTTANGGYEEILVSVIVYVGESGRDADPVSQADPGFLGDVPELAGAQVLPQLTASDLIDEVDIVEAVAVDVSHSGAVSVVVVNGHVIPGRFLDCVLDESDSAFLYFVSELELIKHFELVRRLDLRFFPGIQRLLPDVRIRAAKLRHGVARRRYRILRGTFGSGRLICVLRCGLREQSESQAALEDRPTALNAGVHFGIIRILRGRQGEECRLRVKESALSLGPSAGFSRKLFSPYPSLRCCSCLNLDPALPEQPLRNRLE